MLRDVYVRGKYRDVILPMTVLRRLDTVLEPTKRAVVDMKDSLDEIGIADQKVALLQAAGQAFYNTSKFTFHDLRARANPQQLRADFEDYLDGFSPSVQDILDNFAFRNQIPRLSRADAVGTLIEKLTSPDINLSPEPVMNTDGTVWHPGLDNHGMGTVFEELIRRFNEENNEEAGEHFTPRDAVQLMAKLVFLPVSDDIDDGSYLLYDGACGTGGMLTVGEDVLQQLAEERGKHMSTHQFRQEINAETYAICKADLLLKGEGEAADNIFGGPQYSTHLQRRLPHARGLLSMDTILQAAGLFVGAIAAVAAYLLVRIASDPHVIVYVKHDTESRVGMMLIVIENIGRGVAHNVRFTLSRDIPKWTEGMVPTGKKKEWKESMIDGTLATGIIWSND